MHLPKQRQSWMRVMTICFKPILPKPTMSKTN